MDFNLMISIKGNEAFFRDEKSDINNLDNSFLKVGDESYSFKDILENSDIEKFEPKIMSDSVIGDQDLKYIGKLLKDKKDLIIAKLQEIKKDPVKNVQLELKTKKELERLNIVFSFISSSVLEKENKVSNLSDNHIYNLESNENILSTADISDSLNINIEKETLDLSNEKIKVDNPEIKKNILSSVKNSESLVLISNKINTKITSLIENKAILSGIEIYVLPSMTKTDQTINYGKLSILKPESKLKSNQIINQKPGQINVEQTDKLINTKDNFNEPKTENKNIKVTNNQEVKLNKNINIKTYSSANSNILKPILSDKTFLVSKIGEKAFSKDINKITADIYSYRNFSIKSEIKKNITKNALPEQDLKGKYVDRHVNVDQAESRVVNVDRHVNVDQAESRVVNVDRHVNVDQAESRVVNVDRHVNVDQAESPLVNADRHVNVDQAESPLVNVDRHVNVDQAESPLVNVDRHVNVDQVESPLVNVDRHVNVDQAESRVVNADRHVNVDQAESPLVNVDRHVNVDQVESPLVSSSNFIYSELGKNFINSAKKYETIEQEEKPASNVKYIKPEQKKFNIDNNAESVEHNINSENKIINNPIQVKTISEVFASKINTKVTGNEFIDNKIEKTDEKVKVKNEVKTSSLDNNTKGNVYSDLYNSFVNNSRKFIFNLNDNKKLSNITTLFAGNLNKVNNENDKKDNKEIKKVTRTYNVVGSSIINSLKDDRTSLVVDKKIINENTDLSNRLERKYNLPQNNLYNKTSKEIISNLKENSKETIVEKGFEQLDNNSFTLSSKFVSKSNTLQDKKYIPNLEIRNLIKNNIDENKTKLTDKEIISDQKISSYMSNILDSKTIGKISSSNLNINKTKVSDPFSLKANESKVDIKEVKNNIINSPIEKNKFEERSVTKSLSDIDMVKDGYNLPDPKINKDIKTEEVNNDTTSLFINDPVNPSNGNEPINAIKDFNIKRSSVQHNEVKSNLNYSKYNINEYKNHQENASSFSRDINREISNNDKTIVKEVEENITTKVLDNKNDKDNVVDSIISSKDKVISNPINKGIGIFNNILALNNKKISTGITVSKDTILDIQSTNIPFNVSVVKTSSELSDNPGKTLGQDINKIVPDIYSYKNKFPLEKFENKEVNNVNKDDNFILSDIDNSLGFDEEIYEKFLENPINFQLIKSFGQNKSIVNNKTNGKINLPSVKDDNLVSTKKVENNKGSFIGKNFINDKISESNAEPRNDKVLESTAEPRNNKVYSFIVANKLPEKLNILVNKFDTIKNNEVRQVKSKDISNKTITINKVVKKDTKENLDDVSKRLLEKLESLQSPKIANITNSKNISKDISIENIIPKIEESDNSNLDKNQVIENILEKDVEPILIHDKTNNYLAVSSSSLFKNKYVTNNSENIKNIGTTKSSNANELFVSDLEQNKTESKISNYNNSFNKFDTINREVKREKLFSFNKPETTQLGNHSDSRKIKNNISVKPSDSKNTVLFEKAVKNYVTKNPDKNIFVGEVSLNINNKLEKLSNNIKFENVEIKNNKNIVTENLHKNIINSLENRFDNKTVNKFSIKKYEIKTELRSSNDKQLVENINQKPIEKYDGKFINTSANQLTKNNFIGMSFDKIKNKIHESDVFPESLSDLFSNKSDNGISEIEVKFSHDTTIFNKFDSKLTKPNKENIINRTEVDFEDIDEESQEYEETIFTPFETNLKSEKHNSDNNIEHIILNDNNHVDSHDVNVIQNILENPSLYMPNLIKESNFDGNNFIDSNKKLFTLFSNNLTSEYPEVDLIQMTYEDTYHPQEMNIINKSDYVQDLKENKFSDNQTDEKFVAEELEINYDEMDSSEFINEELDNTESSISDEDSDINPLVVNNVATIIDSINNGIPIHFSEIPEIVKVVSNTIKNNKPFVLNISLNPFNMGEMNMTFKLTEGNKMSISVETSTLAGHRAMEAYFSSIKNIVKENSLVLQEMVSNYSPDIKNSRKERQDSNAKFDNESSNSEAGNGQQTRKKKRRGKSEEKDELKVDV